MEISSVAAVQVDSEESLKAKARTTSIVEGSSYSFMDGFGLRYVAPYAVALGASTGVIGLLGSLPGLLGNVSQLFTLKSMKKNSRQKIVFFGVLLQAIMWIPFIAIGILYFNNILNSFDASALMLVCYCLLTIFGAIAGPAWTSWMKDVIPDKSAGYFAKRNMIAGSIALGGMLVAGLVLDYFKNTSVIIGFAILFFIAFLGRGVSAYMFTKQYEPKFVYDESTYFSFWDFVKKMAFNNFGRYVLLLSAMSFAVAIASPFFGVYMLKNLGFEKNYIYYTLITMSPAMSSLVFMPQWGKVIDKYGSVTIMKISGLFITLVPIFWLITAKVTSPIIIVPYLIISEAFSGFVWAGFNLATSIFTYEAVTRQRVAICATYHGIISATAAFFGAAVGAFLSHQDSLSRVFGWTPLLMVFLISGIMRFVVYLFIHSKIKEVRPVEELKIGGLRSAFKYVAPRYLFNLGVRRVGHSSQHPEGA